MQRLLDFPINPNDIEAIRDQAIYELLYSSGLRLAEVLGTDSQRWHGNQEEIRVLGKGSKERIVPVGLRRERRYQTGKKNDPSGIRSH